MEIKSNQCLIISWQHEIQWPVCLRIFRERDWMTMSTIASPLSWGISRCVQHCFAKCFSHAFLAAWMGSWALKNHFTLRIAWVLERELKGVGLMASRKLQATWDPPLVLLPWSYDWQLWCRNWVVPLPAEAALALGLLRQLQREGLSVTKQSLCAALPGTS